MVEYVILGTSHSFQESAEFARRVGDVVSRHAITLIAEENPFNVPTKANDAAKRFGIPYLQIDLPYSEWGGHGIEREMNLRERYLQGEDCRLSNADAIREDLWLKKISTFAEQGRVLIICGYLHLHFLAQTISQRGNRIVDKVAFPPELLEREPDMILSPPELEEHIRKNCR